MAHGKSLEMSYITRTKPLEPRETKVRDRSLNGRRRIRARKHANKISRRNDG